MTAGDTDGELWGFEIALATATPTPEHKMATTAATAARRASPNLNEHPSSSCSVD